MTWLTLKTDDLPGDRYYTINIEHILLIEFEPYCNFIEITLPNKIIRGFLPYKDFNFGEFVRDLKNGHYDFLEIDQKLDEDFLENKEEK